MTNRKPKIFNGWMYTAGSRQPDRNLLAYPEKISLPENSSPAYAKQPVGKPRIPVVFWLLLTISVSLVIGTVLLSNDMKHLRTIDRYFRFGLFSYEVKPPPPKALPRPTPSASVRLPLHATEPPTAQTASAFLRTWRVSGAAMCAALRDAGIQTSEWAAASFNANTFECYFEHSGKREKDQLPSSIFVIVRGDAAGTISNMRVKIVNPQTDQNGQLDPNILRIFEVMLNQPQWLDFHEALNAIKNLRDIKEDGFGASITFSREVLNPDRYNFTLSLDAAPGPQTRTRNYFSDRTWLPSPEPTVETDPAQPAPPSAQ
ncbi:exopolysaccharide production protein [Rhizobium etli CIAT 652]|uniref:Exopolysaccharide production protein n=1 Tax=Rhizobium etli (strain CIAT 652) TaxID=491916 RepID=B3PWG2_RHIE6|nr:exopolysaccharide production protein [Rhizobium etli CIAT 652]